MTTPKTTYEVASIATESDGEWFEITPGELFTVRTSSRNTNGAYLTLEIVAEPRNGVPMHIHGNEEEHFIIVEGTLHMAIGDRTLEATAGMAVTVDKGVPHAWCNLSASPVRMLAIFTPGRIEGLFRAAVHGADYDLETLPAEYGTRIVGPPMRDDLVTILSPRS